MPDSSKLNSARGTTISRYVSFVLLVLSILVFGFFFYRFIRGFLLPLFLAALLVVLFRPLYLWMLRRCGDRAALASGATTTIILLIVLVPVGAMLAFAVHEANQAMVKRDQILAKAVELRTLFGLQKPFADHLDTVEAELRQLDETLTAAGSAASVPVDEWEARLKAAQETIHQAVREVREEALRAAIQLLGEQLQAQQKTAEPDETRRMLIERLRELRDQLIESVGEDRLADGGDWEPEKRALPHLLSRGDADDASDGFLTLLDTFVAKVDQIDPSLTARRKELTDAQVAYEELLTKILGGPIWKWVIELANPSGSQIEQWIGQARGSAVSWLPSITGTATALITGFLVGLAIMSLAMFFFFIDGAAMIQSFMRLSPMDDRHERELLAEFDKVSRAVVLAMLLSALAQGAFGAIGYAIVGLDSLFLLTLLTTVLALVPFVGAGAVWLPCCLWLAFVEQHYFRAIFLAVYGVGVISMVDNFVKPWVLKGQSKLHPLLALLSILGGIQAVGPIGLLVGPLVAAFLQVLLTILQREITSLDAELQQSRSI